MPILTSTSRTTRPPKPSAVRGVNLSTPTGRLFVPATVVDHATFRTWVRSPEYPEKANSAWLDGTIWVENEMEEAFSHNQVKSELYLVLGLLCRETDGGYLFNDGMLFTNLPAGVSREPDAMFVSHAALDAGRATMTADDDGHIMEVGGTPDVVVEVVSQSSVQKDTELLYHLYWQAGVSEYWLIDARGTDIRFDLFRYRPTKYVAARPTDGWRKSDVFGRQFRLTVSTDRNGFRRPRFEIKLPPRPSASPELGPEVP